ncbi:PTS sugar transporter subunit IIA [Vibrio tapetis]|uniref:Uncharacterized protein n=1 Tax=Vibrio tapetis subsp. tapetis TaxID=1671868 RepID=A0A2N8ZC64_9VIBR|nr:PTS sugar transporter subunit IIA [Vibrio tapetis]SON49491.1 conserved protein of unknown function [Vibrio tapetis subsp. tapetis]
MIERRITFILPKDGFVSWKVNRLKTLGSMFRSVILLVNHTRDARANAEQTLQVMALGGREHDLCQLHIEGTDAELACMVMTDFIADQFTLVNTAHKSNVKTNIELIKQLPTFDLPFELNFTFKYLSHPNTKNDVLAHASRMLSPDSVVKMFDALYQRETTSSTAIGHGIALPHVMNDNVDTPSMVVIQLAEEIDWQSKMGNVQFVIALALPKPPERNMIMAFTHLTKSLLHQEYCQVLTSSREPEAVKAILIHRLAQAFPSNS